MSGRLDIICAQINPVVGDITGNADKILSIWAEHKDTSLIVFPELALCGYTPEDMVSKPAFIHYIKDALQHIAKKSKKYNAAAVVTCPWEEDGEIFNAALVMQGGEIRHKIFKHDLPNYGVFDEKRIFAQGALPAPVNINGHKIGIMICEDMWTAGVAAHLKAQGAEMLIVTNASPFEVTKQNQRLEAASSRCSETRLPLIYVNQCGGQDDIVYDGGSFVMSEGGDVLMQAQAFAEDIRLVIWEKNDGGRWLCACGDGSITPYPMIGEAVYSALVYGLRDYVRKNGFPGALIGMSGGVDSALSAAIAVDALGADAVHCVMMPSEYTSAESLKDAQDCAAALGVRYDSISIKAPVAALHSVLQPHLGNKTPPITYENIQPRTRGIILMALSNANGNMVLSTGNKSEIAVGYSTLYGDMCGGFNVLKDVYKTQVYELCAYRNHHKPDHCLGPQGVVIPLNIIKKAPSAELKENQTDQDSLPPYDVLDDILHSLIEEDEGIDEIIARGHDRDTVIRTWRMLDFAEYKRRQAAPGVKITARAFGRERRYPITNHFAENIAEN